MFIRRTREVFVRGGVLLKVKSHSGEGRELVCDIEGIQVFRVQDTL